MEEKSSNLIRDLLIVILSVIVSTTFAIAFDSYGLFGTANTKDETLKASELTVSQVAEKAIACSVSVLTKTSSSINYYNTAGSGVILSYDEQTGTAYVISNDHVIANCVKDATVVYYLNKYYQATIIGTDPDNDISVIAFKPGFHPVVAEIGRCLTALNAGEQVVAVGNAAGLDYTVTDGIISFVGRAYDVYGVSKNYVQTSAVINHGNSGGGLFDMQGKLIAINTLGIGNYDDLNFSLPMKFDGSVLDNNANYDTSRRDALTSFNCLVESHKKLVAEENTNLVGYISGQKYIGARFESLTQTTLLGTLLKTAYVSNVYSYFNLEGNPTEAQKWAAPKYAATDDTKNYLIDTVDNVRYSTDNGTTWQIAFVESSDTPGTVVYLANANFSAIDIANFVSKQSIGTLLEFSITTLKYNSETGAISNTTTNKTIRAKVSQYQFKYAQ